MEKVLYDEMNLNINEINSEINLSSMKIFLFGHCNASLELIDLLESKGLRTTAILDNSDEKQGLVYKDAPVIYPRQILDIKGPSIVLITSRFYASMQQQLRELSYDGMIRKVIDYNSFAEYSVTENTIFRMKRRERRGNELLSALSKKYEGHFKVFCPFNALGDIYFMMSYWPAFAGKRGIDDVVFCVTSGVLADVIRLFGDELVFPVEVYKQKELDAMIQSAIFTKDKDCFVAHQDRPYVVDLTKALYIKCIPLEQIYCCGVYGLPKDTESAKPRQMPLSIPFISCIPEGRAVVFSPYAKSVTAISQIVWEDAVEYFTDAGYKCYTNVVGDEIPLRGTEAISPSVLEMRAVVERAGIFVGIRSGLCDVIRTAECKKIALYPDYNYSDTRWKSIDMYAIEGFENIVVKEGDTWKELKKMIKL